MVIREGDDSCSKCGLITGDGLPHLVCPNECAVCGYVGLPGPLDGCACCEVLEMYYDLSEEQKRVLKEMLTSNGE